MNAIDILNLMKIGEKTKQGNIIKYFIKNGKISSYECFLKFKYTRLSDLIYRMRKAGIKVEDEWGYSKDNTRFKIYILGEQENVTK